MKPSEFFSNRHETMRFLRDARPENDVLSGYSFFSDKVLKVEDTRLWMSAVRQSKAPDASLAEQRAVGAVLGLCVGDALGAPLEFSSVNYEKRLLSGFDEDVWKSPRLNRFGLKPGQWTDDASMALCLADSLLASQSAGFDPLDLRFRFVLWWKCGYNNAFGDDGGRGSVGLGGNISLSMREFQLNPDVPFTQQGDSNTSGNGSLMRLAPCPVAFWRDPEQAMQLSAAQSYTTHRGTEAAEACRLLAFILCKALRAPPPPRPADGADADDDDDDEVEEEGGPARFPVPAVRSVLEDLSAFSSPAPSVRRLAAAEQEAPGECPSGPSELADRDWRWKRPEHRYSVARAAEQPGYVGSYAMDALAMALHCVWRTRSFRAAVLRAANMRGDADTVAAITAQIAGAIHGVEQIPAEWVEAVERWDGQGRIAATARALFHLHASSEEAEGGGVA